MYLSALPPNKQAPAIWVLLDKLPENLAIELKRAKIIYRGIISSDGKIGDVVYRSPDDKVFNLVWDDDFAEVRLLDRSYIRKLMSTYDATIQQFKIRQPNFTMDNVLVINQKMVFKRTILKKTSKSTSNPFSDSHM